MFKNPGTYLELAPESILKINKSLDVELRNSNNKIIHQILQKIKLKEFSQI